MQLAGQVYRKILKDCPGHVNALINLGSLNHEQKRALEAERLYRAATECGRNCALAFFDLGNVLDDVYRRPEAIRAFLRALQINPRYADAHYTLAVTYQRVGLRRLALPHWKHYALLDKAEPWASHAKLQIKTILSASEPLVETRAKGMAQELSFTRAAKISVRGSTNVGLHADPGVLKSRRRGSRGQPHTNPTVKDFSIFPHRDLSTP